MSFSHVVGTTVFLLHIFVVNGQFGQQLGNFPPGPGTQGGGRGQRPIFGPPGGQGVFNGGFNFANVPPPPGFLPLNRVQDGLPRQFQNALPRNPFGNGASGVNAVLNGGGFTNRFGPARGMELTRQLSPAPPGTFGGFEGGAGGPGPGGPVPGAPQFPPNFPGFNQIQGQPPNFAPQMGPGMNNFGQQFPGAAPLQAGLGARNQPQDVMPRTVGAIDMSSIQPGQRFGNEPALPPPQRFNFPPQNAQTQSMNTFSSANSFSPQPQQPPVGTFGRQPSFGQPQSFGTQGFGTQSSGQSVQQRMGAQSFGTQPSLAFPQHSITQPLGVGRPASQTSIPQGAPQLLPGELEIAPPISPAAAAAIQGSGGGNAPPSVSEIITISDINGNVLYRGVDLADSEIEKITQQLVNNMTDAQAAEAAARGKELESQGRLDAVGPPPLSTGQGQPSQDTSGQQQQQSTGGFGGFGSWGQQSALRFPGQDSVVGESRTVLNFMKPTNDQSG